MITLVFPVSYTHLDVYKRQVFAMDYAKINEAAQNYLEDMTRFLRAIVKNPGESCDEKAHIDTIAAEMKKLDFDQVVICLLYTSR